MSAIRDAMAAYMLTGLRRIGPSNGGRAVEGRLLRSLGRLGLRGLFDADHLFIVEAPAVAESRFIQRERFTGALVPFVRRSLDRRTLPAFQAANAAIKDRAAKAIAAGV